MDPNAEEGPPKVEIAQVEAEVDFGLKVISKLTRWFCSDFGS